jgi:hypothetical protein
MENTELLDKILELQKEGKIAFMTIDGLVSADINNIIQQPAEGLLYDLNRDTASLMSLAKEGKNKRWINDMALAHVVTKLVEKCNALSKANEELTNNNTALSIYVAELEEHIAEKEGSIKIQLNDREKYEPINSTAKEARRMGDEHLQNISFQL